MKFNRKFLLALAIVLIVLCSVSAISAEDSQNNMTSVSYEPEDAVDVCEPIEVDNAQNLQSSEGDLLSANNVVTVHVFDSYNETSKNWNKEGTAVNGATVEILDYSNNSIKTVKTNAKGAATITNLATGKYYIKVSHSTYEPMIEEIDFNKGNVVTKDFIFVPDILLLVSYSDHNEKVDLLMNMSRRVAYISTTDFDKSRQWLCAYAKFIHVDMFSEASYTILTSEYLRDLLNMSIANKNYNVAYTFGTYNDNLLSSLNIHIVGAGPSNNTFHTVENTYIGSYFQAEDIDNGDVLFANMKNYLDYVYYLIDSENYINPTLDANNAPAMTPECGFYHPDLGLYSVVPENTLINQWIVTNPGYSAGDGSLNWMVDNYAKWLVETLDPTVLFKQFENDYVGNFSADKKFIAIASYYAGGDLVDALIRGYEANGRPAFNIFKYSTEPSMSSILNKINKVSVVGISSVNSLYSWSLSYANGSAEGDLSDIDLAVLNGVNEISEYSYNSELGPQIEWTYSVTYPSFEGVYGPVILSYLDETGKEHVIQTGVDKMVKLSCGWADLKDLDNYNKTIAIVLYNYPPGKAEIGASYLDVFKSTYDLILLLSANGYDIGCDAEDFVTLDNLTSIIFDMNNKGSWAKGLLDKYVEDNWDSLMEHHQLINITDFYNLIDDVNDDLIKEMFDYWGNNLGPAMVYNKTDEHYIVIPGVWFGKVFITFQPSRGWEEVTNYHDLTLPPHQQYVAFYEWLDKTAHVNAVVNMGTHGTLEWLPGTNLGAVYGDWTFELQKLPTIYPYIVSNPGEAMVARDRISSLMITHMTPAMVSSDLYGNYSLLENYITRYKDQVRLNVTSNAEEYKSKILELAPTLGFREMYDNETFSSYIDELHLYLEDMGDDFNTYGLHYLGKVLTGMELVEEVASITTSQTQIYNHILHLIYGGDKQYVQTMTGKIELAILEYSNANASGLSISELNKKYGFVENASYANVMDCLVYQWYVLNQTGNMSLSNKDYFNDIDHNVSYLEVKETVRSFLFEYITRLVNGESVADLNDFYGIGNGTALYGSTGYAESVIVNIQNNNEWEAILSALSGSYVNASLFADPAYGDSIPTGFSGYSSDSTKMPTEAAYQSAVKIVDLLLANYYEQHGQWPELTSLILWGTEISRTEGIGVAEFLYFLGCKPQWTNNGKVNGTELIPLEDLTVTLSNGTVVNRPRIDVFASMVTSNKDWITWMVTAVRLAAFAEGENETNNYVIKHYNENPSLDRLFGLPGNILEGTGMSNLIPNTANWNIETVNEMGADIYLNKVSYAWTIDENGNVDIHNNRESLEYLLTKTDLITQNFDSTWRLFDSDDYYDWFGGLYNAANVMKNKSGINSKPDTAFVDIRNQNNYISRTYDEEVEFEIRTKILNPKYYGTLITTAAGMNAYSAQMQNFFAATVIGDVSLNTATYNQISDTLIDISPSVSGPTTAAGYQSSVAWMIYASQTGMWQGDSGRVQKLVDEYMNSVIQYGVACCHHTCKNLEFNSKLIQMSSLTPAEKQKFAEILAQATDTDPLYTADQQQDNSETAPDDSSSNSSSSSNEQSNNNENANVLYNGSSEHQESSSNGGVTSAGNQPVSGDANAKEASDAQSDASMGNANVYELSQKSVSKSATATESSMPIFVIIAVILLIAIFLVGYLRNDEDYDDY